MIKLSKVTIQKYKCIEKEQSFNVEDGVTVLVGMNESGKTSILEAIAKSNYFEDRPEFKFNTTQDYPRKQKKAMDKSGAIPNAVILEFDIDKEMMKEIKNDLGTKLDSSNFSVICKYDNSKKWHIPHINISTFLLLNLSSCHDTSIVNKLVNIRNKSAFDEAVSDIKKTTSDPSVVEKIQSLSKYVTSPVDGSTNFIEDYVINTYLKPNLPVFMYYDEYYMLPARVPLDDIENSNADDESLRTAKALLELADVDIDKVIKTKDYEELKAELEATQSIITEELFKYWTTNKNLKIVFDIDKVEERDPKTNKPVIKHVLDIRVLNERSGVSLPLTKRSKGFNWFFSFLVWFKKIQEDRNKTYILLLDEPGLNLHAKAQNDLLRFLSDLSKDYQIIYTTHSPFMIETDKFVQVRTVLETEEGTRISESVTEKDPDTLFPLQAALGYDLAQNLYVSKKNLLVEGIADLTYLSLISEMLEEKGREHLKGDITIVPVGGADKVATFISLLRGNSLNVVCLLDSFANESAKARLNDLVTEKIIKNNKILFYQDIIGYKAADVEDMFSMCDYLKLYNGAFNLNVKESDIKPGMPILPQLNGIDKNKKFNHYAPANYLAQNMSSISLSKESLDNFAELFKRVNKLL